MLHLRIRRCVIAVILFALVGCTNQSAPSSIPTIPIRTNTPTPFAKQIRTETPATATRSIPTPILATSTPAIPIPTPTITFAAHPTAGWNRIPTIVIVAKKDDPRIEAATQAIAWWNDQLQALGSPFHFGTVTVVYNVDPDELVPAKLRTADPADSGNPITTDVPKVAASLGGDIIIALTSYDLTSQNLITKKDTQITRDLILIKNFTIDNPRAEIGPGAFQHELGHALGLMHDSSTHSIMCGPPWNDQQGCLGRAGQVVLDQDKQYLLSIYPLTWKPAP